MAPCTYVGLALGAVPGGRICFRSLEFINANGPMSVLNFIPDQALHFRDLDFVADHLGQLHLHEGDVAPPCTPLQNPRSTHRGMLIIDSNALAHKINAYLRINPEPKHSRCVFYALANTFMQLSGGALMPPEVEF